MVIRNLLISVSLLLCGYESMAQGTGEWVMSVNVSGEVVPCRSARGVVTNVSASFSGGGSSSSSTHYSTSFTVTSSTGYFNGTISGSASGYCDCKDDNGQNVPDCTPVSSASASGSLDVAYSPSDATCNFRGSERITTSNFILNINYSISKRLQTPVVPTNSTGCSTSIEISTVDEAASYIWQVTDNPSSTNWRTIPNKNTATISVTRNDLNHASFTGSLRYVRVNDPLCQNRLSKVSNSVPFDAPPPTASVTWTEPTCFGLSNGQVRINSVSGSSSHYSVTLYYIDSNGANHHYQDLERPASQFPLTINEAAILSPDQYPNLHGIKKGTWRLVIANTGSAGNCPRDFDRNINEPPQLIATAERISDYNGYGITCAGESDGSARVNISGGTPGTVGYTANWTNRLTGEHVSSGTTISDKPRGEYKVTVTDSRSCVTKDSVTLSSPDSIKVNFLVDKVPTCAETTDGVITASVSGGVPDYSYLWLVGGSDPTKAGLGEETYSITVTDANNCTVQDTFFLDAPPPLIAIPEITSLYYDQYSVSCFEAADGTATVRDVIHGTPPYTYSWSNGDNGQEAFNLEGRQYFVTVFDDNNCRADTSVILTRPDPDVAGIEITSDYHGSAIKCNGESNGALRTVLYDPQGNLDTGEYFVWYKDDVKYAEGPTVDSIEFLPAGLYRIVTTYNDHCIAETENFNIEDPDPINPHTTSDSVYHGQIITCTGKKDATIRSVPTGGTGLYKFLWSTNDTTQAVSKLGAGTYSVRVTDINGCIGTDTIELSDPQPVKVFIKATSDYNGFGVSCYGSADGFIKARGTGGTQNYFFEWISGHAGDSITNLPFGNYTVIMADENGCTSTASTSLTRPPDVALTLSDYKNVSCYGGFDGQATLTSSGGVSGYSFSRDNGLTWQTENAFTGLKAGTYTFIVQDANSCRETVGAQLTAPSKINIEIQNIESALCSDNKGSALAMVSGGTGAYTLMWNDVHGTLLRYGPEFTNASGGVYTFTARDGNHCVASKQVPITSEDGAVSAWNATAASCFNSSDGSATITIVDGDGPFNILWPDGQTTLTATNLTGGIHYVMITDANNCTTVQTIEVDIPDSLKINVVNLVIPTCMGGCDGLLEIQANGGAGGYSYDWNGTTSPSQSSLCAGIYPVIVRDANGCTLSEEVELTHPDSILVRIKSARLPTCQFHCDGALEVEAYGGNPGVYQYTWDTGESGAQHSGLCAGSYNLTIADSEGCLASGTVELHDTPPLHIDLGGGVTLCAGQSHTLNPGAAWFNHKWGSNVGFFSEQPLVAITAPGQYWLETYDRNGCVARDTFLLETSYDLLNASFMLSSNGIVGDTVVMIDISWPLPEYTTWEFPEQMQKLNEADNVVFGQFNEPGTYEIGIHAHLGECYDYLGKTITISRDTTDSNEGGRLGYMEYVKEYVLHPNPTDGNFEVSVELIEEGPITLSIWNVPTNYIIRKVHASGDSLYRIAFDLRPLSSGSYILRLDHKKGASYLRLIVN